RLVKMLIHADRPVKCARVAILGLTFKENVPDLRNSRVPDIVTELQQFGIQPMVHDPVADADEAEKEYGIRLADWSELGDLDGIVLAVAHRQYHSISDCLREWLRPGAVVVDVKCQIKPCDVPDRAHYWSL
ncbi:MAG TPA: UDP-glucose/GDP-mannose dehydrogenase family protein, partial [Chthonomonadales bacterium]|nr:UDP-glucose/GDP-mannose dehydrogenase family protein [Chthonomonadales bacterium]